MPKVKKVGSAHKSKLKVAHPNSRKASQLSKEVHHKEKVERRKAEKKRATTTLISKLMWFREQLEESKTVYTKEEMLELIERYLHRHDEDLEKLLEPQLEKKHTGSHYRLQFASREDALRSTMVRERELFEGAGFEAPDLTSQKVFKTFLEWKGEEDLLPKIPLKSFQALKTDI